MNQKNNSEIKLIVAIGADHAGYPLKEDLQEWLGEQDVDIIDVGAHSMDPLDDYPDFARYVGQAIQHGHAERGVVICGSGVGACVAANKLDGVRASICNDTYSAAQGVEHDNINVLCLGARIVGVSLANELVIAFVNAKFNPEERYARRLDKVKAIEAAH